MQNMSIRIQQYLFFVHVHVYIQLAYGINLHIYFVIIFIIIEHAEVLSTCVKKYAAGNGLVNTDVCSFSYVCASPV